MIQVFINQGRYLAQCPRCGEFHVVEPRQTSLLCPMCWKGLDATKIVTDEFGASVLVPHFERIFAVQDEARAAGQEYLLEFPDPRIMDILRPRPIHNMNWMPGETIEDLRQENAAHGLEA